MTKRGRPRKPYAIKERDGFPGGKAREREDEVVPPPLEQLDPPDWLDKSARKVWSQIAPELRKNGVLTTLDLFAAARYCDIFVKWLDARETLDREGAIVYAYHFRTPQQIEDGVEPEVKSAKPHPAARAYKELLSELLRLEGQFGMTPSARSGLVTSAKTPGEKETFKNKLYG